MIEPFDFQGNLPDSMKDRILKVSTEGRPGRRPGSSYHISQLGAYQAQAQLMAAYQAQLQAMAGMEVNQAALYAQMAAYGLQGLDPSALALAAAQAQAAAEKDGDADDEDAEAGEVQHTATVSAASNAAVYSQIMLGQMLAAQQGMIVAPAGLPAAAVSSPSLAHTALLNGTNSTSTPTEYYSDNDEDSDDDETEDLSQVNSKKAKLDARAGGVSLLRQPPSPSSSASPEPSPSKLNWDTGLLESPMSSASSRPSEMDGDS